MNRSILLLITSLGLVTALPWEIALAIPQDKSEPTDLKDPDLAAQLRRRVASDQESRKAVLDFVAAHKLPLDRIEPDKLEAKVAEEFKKISDDSTRIDAENMVWLKDVISKKGWPGKSLVGGQGAKDAWILIQHADADREFQQLCLRKMESLPQGEVDPRDVAYLTDRVLVGTGKKQKYGTQAIYRDGKFVPNPIENEAEVDQRRKAVGLEPLDEYLKFMEQIYLQPGSR